MIRSLTVRTASRLHFGLTSLGGDSRRRHFGGIGAMIDVCGVAIQVAPANRFEIVGPLNTRVKKIAERFVQHQGLGSIPGLSLTVSSARPEHVGLGVGTQLALAVVASLSAAFGLPWDDPAELSSLAGRGRRSAVGTYGFYLGGLIVDGGHADGESLGQLVDRVELPAEWRFVLLRDRRTVGRSGAKETQAMESLPPVPAEVTQRLERLIHDEILVALKKESFDDFSSAIYDYGILAGECFASVQGGPFANPLIARLVQWIRGQGVLGVGQSSWGPTVYSILPDDTSARSFVETVLKNEQFQEMEVIVAKPANRGASVTVNHPALQIKP